jgi:hypothetical protein
MAEKEKILMKNTDKPSPYRPNILIDAHSGGKTRKITPFRKH